MTSPLAAKPIPARGSVPRGANARDAHGVLQLTVTLDGAGAQIGDTPLPVTDGADPRIELARAAVRRARAAGKELYAILTDATGKMSALLALPDGRVLEAELQRATTAAVASSPNRPRIPRAEQPAESVPAWPSLYLAVTADGGAVFSSSVYGHRDRQAVTVPDGMTPHEAAVGAAARYMSTELGYAQPVRAACAEPDGKLNLMIIYPDGTSKLVAEVVPPGARHGVWRAAARHAAQSARQVRARRSTPRPGLER